MELINIKGVSEIVGLSKTTIYELMKNESFPRPGRLPGVGRSLWDKAEILNWNTANFRRTS